MTRSNRFSRLPVCPFFFLSFTAAHLKAMAPWRMRQVLSKVRHALGLEEFLQDSWALGPLHTVGTVVTLRTT